MGMIGGEGDSGSTDGPQLRSDVNGDATASESVAGQTMSEDGTKEVGRKGHVHFDETQVPDSGTLEEVRLLNGTDRSQDGNDAESELQEIVKVSLGDSSIDRKQVLAAYGIVESGEVGMKASEAVPPGGVDALPDQPEIPEEDDEQEQTKKTKEPKAPSVPYWQLFRYADWLDILLMSLGTAGAIVHGVAFPIFFIFFGQITDTLSSKSGAGAVLQYAPSFVGVIIAIGVGSYAEVAFWMQTGERQASRLRELYLAAILKQEVAFFDQGSSSGKIVAAVTSDVLLVQDAMSEKVGNFLNFFSTFIAGMIIGFINVWQLALVVLAVLPLIATCGATYAVVLSSLTSKEQKAYAGAGEIAQQAISQVRTVYSFVAEEKTLGKYLTALETTLRLGIKAGLTKGLGIGGVFGVILCSWALQLWYASTLVASGAATGGETITTMFSVLLAGISLGQALPNLQFFAKGQAAAYSIFSTLTRQPAINVDDPAGERLEGGTVQGEITLTDVHFAYPARPDVTIFQGFSLTIPARTSIAIVGPSGSGKSTVVALIQRFYDPLAGTVALDGKDLRSLNLRSLRAHIGLVGQEPALFETSILENIMYGKPDATAEEVEVAAKAANAHIFISQMPQGYDTQVGEQGVFMSGGQRQRIGIARAILRNPEILLLDEATSALDTQSERVVQEALDGIMEGRTTVIIAHRLTTIRNADSIAVVAQGKIMEQGKHDELMARGEGSEYAALVRTQLAAAEVSNEALAQSISMARSMSRLSSARSDWTMDDEDDADLARKTNQWVRLFKLTLPELPFTVGAIIGAAGAGASNPVFGFLITSVFVTFFGTDLSVMRNEVNKDVIALACLGAVSFCAYTLQHYMFGIVGENLTRRVREAMLRAILRYEVGWFDDDLNSSGAVAGRLSSDATLLKAAITDRISILFQNLSVLLTAFTIAFILSWRMALVVSASLPVLVACALAQQAFLTGMSGDLEKAHHSASTLASEAVTNIRTVAAFGLEERLMGLFRQQLRGPQKRALLRGQVSGFFYGLSNLVMFGTFGLLFLYMSTIIPQYTSFSNSFKVFMILMMTSFAIAETLTLAPDFVKGGAAISSFFRVIDRQPLIVPDDEGSDAIPPDAGAIKGEIELKKVRFAYPTRPDAILFDDFSLRVPAGKTLALVGRSGSGKSSVISLIERFYDPLSGKVYVDQKDIRKVNLRSLRAHIGLVSQEPALFNMTIRENILFGRDHASEAEVIEAAKAANAHKFVSSLPSGYETNVGERGTQLSGGQKQRIAIARAVLKNPAILLLDEATSALDAESERVVQEALDRLMVGRTSVVVAHRLSTIRQADIIAVVQDGKVIEKGTHERLYSNPESLYHALVKANQARGH